MDDGSKRRIQLIIDDLLECNLRSLEKRISDHQRASMSREIEEKRVMATKGYAVDWEAYSYLQSAGTYVERADWMREAAESFFRSAGDAVHSISSCHEAGTLFRSGADHMLAAMDDRVKVHPLDSAFGSYAPKRLRAAWKNVRPRAERIAEIEFLNFLAAPVEESNATLSAASVKNVPDPEAVKNLGERLDSLNFKVREVKAALVRQHWNEKDGPVPKVAAVTSHMRGGGKGGRPRHG